MIKYGKEKALPKRVKLINLPDSAQAVVHVRDETHMEMTIYGYNSDKQPVQLIAPFSFESKKSRDDVFYRQDGKLKEFAKSVFLAQMAVIDPKLNLDNFKTEKNGR